MTKKALYGAIIGVVSLHAQDAVSVQDKLRAEAQMVQTMNIGRTIKGAPYSAQAVNESTQALADGNRITRTNTTTLYRDSLGRERREEMSSEGVVQSIFISDPVEGVTYTLRPETKVAVKNFQRKIVTDGSKTSAVVAAPLSKTDVDALVKREVETVMMKSMIVSDANFITVVGGSMGGDLKTEDLGTQLVLGVSAVGTRRTTTIPAGKIGNEMPIVTVNERWVSPELQVLVMSTRSDPRTGTTTYKLTNIDRSEPAPTLFQVPPDYTLSDVTRAKGMSIRPDEQQ